MNEFLRMIAATRIVLPLLVIGLMAAAFVGYRNSLGQAPRVRYTVPDRFQQELINLDLEALNHSYVAHANRLWDNYVSQVANLGHETTRIDTGIDNLHKAWVIARESIEKREKALNKCVGC